MSALDVSVKTHTRIPSVKEYVQQVLGQIRAKNPAEPEFHQATQEVFDSLVPVLERHPEYRSAKLLERVSEPERVIMFRVPPAATCRWCKVSSGACAG